MIKRWLGIDGIDFVIQAIVTMFAAFLASGFGPGQDERIAMVFGISVVVLGIRRHFALERAGRVQAPDSGEYVLELEQRVAELESAQQRLYELEERVDFTERVLAQKDEARVLKP
jgi:hypothetical protein